MTEMTKPHKVEQGYMHENYRKLIHNVEGKVLFLPRFLYQWYWKTMWNLLPEQKTQTRVGGMQRISQTCGQQFHSRRHGESTGKPFPSSVPGRGTGVAWEGEVGMDGRQMSGPKQLSLLPQSETWYLGILGFVGGRAIIHQKSRPRRMFLTLSKSAFKKNM